MMAFLLVVRGKIHFNNFIAFYKWLIEYKPKIGNPCSQQIVYIFLDQNPKWQKEKQNKFNELELTIKVDTFWKMVIHCEHKNIFFLYTCIIFGSHPFSSGTFKVMKPVCRRFVSWIGDLLCFLLTLYSQILPSTLQSALCYSVNGFVYTQKSFV